jgi:hypothetical protein
VAILRAFREGWDVKSRPSATLPFCFVGPRDPLLFVIFTIFFFKFSPKTACQVPKPPNFIKPKKIEVAI